jgi:hypothetical protein
MGFKRFMKAAFKTRNFAVLAAVIVVTLLFSVSRVPQLSAPFMLAGAAGYIYFVMQTLRSGEFKAQLAQEEKLDGIQKLSWDCNELYRNVIGKLDRNLKSKAAAILRQKNELMRFFSKYSDNPLKQRIIEQALKLVMAYLNLLYTYSTRSRELSSQSLNELVGRINYNNRKLGSLKSYEAVLDLTKTIEMDEKLLKSMREEREELEKTNVRLDYIESTIGAFKHRILSPDSMDPAAEEIEDVINEATALDNVLNEHSRNRMRI